MKIIVEDSEIDLDLPDRPVTLREVIDEVETFLFEVDRIPTALSINGQVWTQEDLDTRQDDLLSGSETVEFGIQTVYEFIGDNLDGAGQANEELLKNIAAFAEAIHSGSSAETATLVEEINNFFEFWLKLQSLLPEEFNSITCDGKPFEGLFDNMRSLFEEIVTAMEGHDFVLAADLLQYEVMPAIESLHRAIPALQERLSARCAPEKKTETS